MIATSNNFAEALFILASEENAVDTFYTDLKTVSGAFEQNPEYAELLSAPSISKSDRLQTIEKVFGDKVSTHILSFLKLLCEKGKIGELSDIFTDFEKLREELRLTAHAVATSAVELDNKQCEKLIKALEKRTGKKVVLKTVIDKSVLGGLTVTLDGELIDGSVRSNLKHIREVISE